MDQLPIINKVANSKLITFDLEEYYTPGDRILYDIKDNLFQGLILREKDFREFLMTFDWSAAYKDKFVAIHCSVEAIVPTWAYMLLSAKITPFAKKVIFGTLSDLEDLLFREQLSKLDPNDYKDTKVVIKGCSKVAVPESAYVEITRLLQPVVSSIMYGEPCSTVPIFKRSGKKV